MHTIKLLPLKKWPVNGYSDCEIASEHCARNNLTNKRVSELAKLISRSCRDIISMEVLQLPSCQTNEPSLVASRLGVPTFIFARDIPAEWCIVCSLRSCCAGERVPSLGRMNIPTIILIVNDISTPCCSHSESHYTSRRSRDLVTSVFQDGVLCHIHAMRVTLKIVDIS